MGKRDENAERQRLGLTWKEWELYKSMSLKKALSRVIVLATMDVGDVVALAAVDVSDEVPYRNSTYNRVALIRVSELEDILW